MKIANEFTVNTPIDRAWALLTDLEGIAPCLPGAQLTGVDGDIYQGKVKVKVGPVISEFAGTAKFTEKDDAGHRAVIDAKGRDARSAGNAAALVTAQLRPDGDKTLVSVDTDLKISGKLAQFGSGMIKEVSGKLLAQFVANLEAKLAAEETPAAGTSPEATPQPAGAAAGAAASAPAAASVLASGPESVASVPPAGPESAEVVAGAAASASAATSVSETALEPAASVPEAALESAGAAAGAAATVPAAASAPATPPPLRILAPPAEEPEALDLLGIAGRSIFKRVIPVAVGLVVAGTVIAWLVARRR